VSGYRGNFPAAPVESAPDATKRTTVVITHRTEKFIIIIIIIIIIGVFSVALSNKVTAIGPQ